MVAFGEFACTSVLKNVPHRHFVFSIPKIIRIYFLYDRTLLKELVKIAWEVLSLYYTNAVNKKGAVPAAICSIQTFGDMLGFNPHLHILAADGGFSDNGTFYAAAADLNASILEPLFRHRILSMLKRRKLIGDRLIKLVLSWRHTGFNVYLSDRIYPRFTQSMENLARYIIRASFSQERLNYISEASKVIYKSKSGSDTKEFDAIDFIASICSHIPNKNEQMVRYTGYYSNVCRGRRKKQGTTESEYVIEDDPYNKGYSKSWARLIKKIYEVDPLICLKWGAHHFRHSKSVHLLQSGVNLIYIRDFLGHCDCSTTEIYARADTEMKRKAIEAAYSDVLPIKDLPLWADDTGLMMFLNSLCKK